jgi:hypothetical protein
MFFNSTFFGYSWSNVCDVVGGEGPLCAYMSFGVYGHKELGSMEKPRHAGLAVLGIVRQSRRS